MNEKERWLLELPLVRSLHNYTLSDKDIFCLKELYGKNGYVNIMHMHAFPLNNASHLKYVTMWCALHGFYFYLMANINIPYFLKWLL